MTDVEVASNENAQAPQTDLNALINNRLAQLQNGPPAEEESPMDKLAKKKTKELRRIVEGQDKPEDKIKSLHQSALQLLGDNRKLDKEMVQERKRADKLMSERDQFNSELAKVNGIKAKLETLCRELQRQNKILLDDNKRVGTEEQQRREELSKKFNDTIKDITTKMEDQADERLKQLKENEMLREKLRNFAEQYEIREQHFATQMKAKDLEHQLLEAKLKQQSEIALQESIKAQAYKEQTITLAKTEAELRHQLNLYAEKFEQFQETLTKSNEVFNTFKQEMEKMTKTIKTLEKENGTMRKKCEQTDKALIELAEERNNYRKQLDVMTAQKKKLEGLCRALQAGRTNTNGNTPSSSGDIAPEAQLPATSQ